MPWVTFLALMQFVGTGWNLVLTALVYEAVGDDLVSASIAMLILSTGSAIMLILGVRLLAYRYAIRQYLNGRNSTSLLRALGAHAACLSSAAFIARWLLFIGLAGVTAAVVSFWVASFAR